MWETFKANPVLSIVTLLALSIPAAAALIWAVSLVAPKAAAAIATPVEKAAGKAEAAAK
jgi:hypothetical protein